MTQWTDENIIHLMLLVVIVLFITCGLKGKWK